MGKDITELEQIYLADHEDDLHGEGFRQWLQAGYWAVIDYHNGSISYEEIRI